MADEQPSAEFEVGEDARALIRAVVEGLADLEAGRELTLRDVKARLGIVQRMPSVEPPATPRRFRG